MVQDERRYTGPIYPVVTPFRDDKSGRYPVDYDALEHYVAFLLDEGAKTIMVASATSRFAQLEIDEIKRINACVVRTVGGRGRAIISTPIQGSTRQHVEIAQHGESIGATDIACEYPWRYQSIDALIAYYQSIIDETTSLGLMAHVTPGRSELGGLYRYDVESLQRLCSLERVFGIKEAAGDPELSRSIWQALAHKTDIIVAGKASVTYLEAHSYGASGFFAGTGNLVPRYSNQIYELANQGNLAGARELSNQHEVPFLEHAKRVGWHAALKAGLAELGLMEITERPPMVPLAEVERQALVACMRECGWLS